MNTKVVGIKRVAGGLMLLPTDGHFDSMRSALNEFTDDFMADRNQGSLEKRDVL